MSKSTTRFGAVVAICAIAAMSLSAQTQLSSGTGASTVTFTVDGWGMFGGCPSNQTAHSDALYTNSANLGPYNTVCYSAVLLDDPTGCAAPGRTLLALADSLYGQFPAQAVNPPVTVLNPGRHIQTAAQSVCGLQIAIDQRLDGPDPIFGSYESSTLVQTYTITNIGTITRNFNLIHFLDSDITTLYSQNRGGASRRLADCTLGAPPYVSNKEWVFEFDSVNAPGVVVALGAEGTDAGGLPIQTTAFRVHASPVGHPSSGFVSNPVGFLTNTIDNDANADLVVTSPEATGDFAMFQGLAYSVPGGGTVTAIFRTRWTSLIASSPTPLETQARDITCSGWGGNYSGAGLAPLLCVNGQGTCASVAPGAPITLSLAAPGAGPTPTHYVLFGIFGEPIIGGGCGSPQASDSALWGPPFGVLGMGAFPVSGNVGTWSGGGATSPGLPLISSLPGFALVTGPLASGILGTCGTPLATLPGGLPFGFSITMQAAVVDNGGFPLAVTLSNAVNLAVGCPCQAH